MPHTVKRPELVAGPSDRRTYIRLSIAMAVISVPLLGLAFEPSRTSGRGEEPVRTPPVVREAFYIMNARVRPLLLFWIGRENVGGARITWRNGPPGHGALELLVGSDPARAPRRINRWGFIAEERHAGGGDVLGLMKESSEKTIEEAEASVAREGQGGSTYKAIRTRIEQNRAVTETMAFRAGADLTYHQLDTLLSMIPDEPSARRTIDLPPGTEIGLLTAMTSIIARAATCRDAERGAAPLPRLAYVYNQTLYDLSISSCDYVRTFTTKRGVFPQVIDGRFRVRNRRTGTVTAFGVAYGTSGILRDLPVRIVFRPRWWMEVELLLDRAPAERDGGRP
jgi:hypothetical protein